MGPDGIKRLKRSLTDVMHSVFGGDQGFPDSYAVMDATTTGTDVGLDYVVRLDERRSDSLRSYWLLDWSADSNIDKVFFRRKLTQAHDAVTANGGEYLVTYDELHRDGVSCKIVLHDIRSQLVEYTSRSRWIVGHHWLTFDVLMLEQNISRYMPKAFQFDKRRMADTSLIVLAAYDNNFPVESESIQDWQSRVAESRKGMRKEGWEVMKLPWLVERLELLSNPALVQRVTAPCRIPQSVYHCNLLWEYLGSLLDE